MKIKNIRSLGLKNKIVLLRVNFDVAIKNGRVIDPTIILAHFLTIKLKNILFAVR